jgi:hypothetical protein
MTPVTPESLFSTIQSGWSANAMLGLAVSAMNGLKNEEFSLSGYTPPDPKFIRAAELLRKIQLSGGVGMRIIQATNEQVTKIITFRSQGLSPEMLEQITEFRTLLGLDLDAKEFTLVYGAVASNDKEIALQTRSVLHMNQGFAMRTEVPKEHVKEGRAVPGLLDNDQLDEEDRSVLVRSTKSRPKNAFVSVKYRDYWFWVDDRDLRAKRAFTFMMLLFTLADTGEREDLPLVTIPAQ